MSTDNNGEIIDWNTDETETINDNHILMSVNSNNNLTPNIDHFQNQIDGNLDDEMYVDSDGNSDTISDLNSDLNSDLGLDLALDLSLELNPYANKTDSYKKQHNGVKNIKDKDIKNTKNTKYKNINTKYKTSIDIKKKIPNRELLHINKILIKLTKLEANYFNAN